MRTEPRSSLDTFSLHGKPAGFTVGGFWQWGMSDLAINIIRAAVAEFLVSKALGCTAKVRNCWGGYDLVSPEGIKIEVKSAAYGLLAGLETGAAFVSSIWHRSYPGLVR